MARTWKRGAEVSGPTDGDGRRAEYARTAAVTSALDVADARKPNTEAAESPLPLSLPPPGSRYCSKASRSPMRSFIVERPHGGATSAKLRNTPASHHDEEKRGNKTKQKH